MFLQAIALSVTTLLTGGVAAADVCCPPVIETVSCLSGASSFAGASCSASTTQFHGWPSEELTCPAGEIAISGGFRALLDRFSGRPPIMAQVTPVVGATGDHAHSYRFVWSPSEHATGAKALGQVRVYVTCQKV